MAECIKCKKSYDYGKKYCTNCGAKLIESEDILENQIEISVAQKNIKLAIVLTILFGPFGLFYATIPGGFIMTIVTFVLLRFGGLLITWPFCILWAYFAIKNYNKKTIIENI